jgi:hypothetical protein
MIRGCNKHVKSSPSEILVVLLYYILSLKTYSSQDLRTRPIVLPEFSVGSRRGLGSGCKAYSFIAGIIDAVETLQEGVSVNEVKALAGVCTNLVDNF